MGRALRKSRPAQAHTDPILSLAWAAEGTQGGWGRHRTPAGPHTWQVKENPALTPMGPDLGAGLLRHLPGPGRDRSQPGAPAGDIHSPRFWVETLHRVEDGTGSQSQGGALSN